MYRYYPAVTPQLFAKIAALPWVTLNKTTSYIEMGGLLVERDDDKPHWPEATEEDRYQYRSTLADGFSLVDGELVSPHQWSKATPVSFAEWFQMLETQ